MDTWLAVTTKENWNAVEKWLEENGTKRGFLTTGEPLYEGYDVCGGEIVIIDCHGQDKYDAIRSHFPEPSPPHQNEGYPRIKLVL